MADRAGRPLPGSDSGLSEDEPTLGWFRLALTVVGLGILPVWMLLTASIAQLSPVGELVLVDGEVQVVQRLDYLGAAWTATAWLLLVGAVVAPLAMAFATIRRSRAMVDGPSSRGEEAVLPADTPWEVTRRDLASHEEDDVESLALPADHDAASQQAPIVGIEAATNDDDANLPPSSKPQGERSGVDDVDDLFR